MTATAFQLKKAIYPLRFSPHYKDYLWGGSRIIQHFHREAPPGIYAESWEVSVRPEGASVVANGPLAGTSLVELFPAFPLLLKILDARSTLSVQVHPDVKFAALHGGEPKTEMWYIIAATPDACVYCGFKPGTDETQLRSALAGGTVADLLEKISVAPGDVINVPGGRVHAIGAGCLILECQQSSNTTYRLYDWDRKGSDGKPRDLHIEQSLRVINWNETAPVKPTPKSLPPWDGNDRDLILATPFFNVERLVLSQKLALPAESSALRLLFVAEGAAEIRCGTFAESAPAGTTYLLPPALAPTTLDPAATETSTIILITAPQRAS